MYRVLARKYRPQTFADLIGQEVLVRTLTNAFASGRIAHAFVLTGIRGIGKTTTARIIARGLNCIGPDGQGEPTTEPCGVCPNCVAIAEDRHVDVIEMDAASRTGVDDVREIIDSVQYAPVSARYKVYIIDEVHMLSKNAFNALLKTLEEPPPHVKFIFATTELRKIPVTIISRCQKFDLKRVELDELSQHLINVSGKENIELPADCAQLIAAAAEGSVRDALSLLDQAIAMHTDAQGNITITAPSVREMLGLADKTQLFTLLQQLFAGDTDKALAGAQQLFTQGADPAMLLSDLLEITHYLTRILAAPALANNVHFSPAEQQLGTAMAKSLNIPALTRAWQILTRGGNEMRHASNTKATLEMVLVRLGYASQLPSPAELVRTIQNGASVSTPSPSPAPRSGNGGGSAGVHNLAPAVSTTSIGGGAPSGAPVMQSGAATAKAIQPEVQPAIEVHSYAEMVQLFEAKREGILASHLINDFRLVRFAPGRIEVKPIAHIAPDVPARINRRLKEWTGQSWQVIFSDAEGEPSIREQRQAAAAKAKEYAISHPKVRAVMDAFPTAQVTDFVPNKKK